jgi:hypothetical protein
VHRVSPAEFAEFGHLYLAGYQLLILARPIGHTFAFPTGEFDEFIL